MLTAGLPGRLALVALGGAAGAVLRWSLTLARPDDPGTFPWTTFAINVVGSLLLALLPGWAAARRSERLTLLLGPGVLGGFTTFSSASAQTQALLEGHAWVAGAYLVGTLVACLAAVHLATRLTRSPSRARRRGAA